MPLDIANEILEMTGEEIVISGISGQFPNTRNTKLLTDNLYNKVDMVSKIDDADGKHPELPQYSGQIDGLDKFDAQFFRVTKWQASSFDPVGRKIMEQAYCAMFDAGINPETLKGSKLGVFIGSSVSDSIAIKMYKIFENNGYIISGCSKTMMANRISYWIDAQGPSYALDYACASSMACLEIAVQRIKAGDCDAAIIGGCIHSTNSIATINMKRSGLLCTDGKTKCFDKTGDGFVRSDAINLLFLQKAKDAKRIYAEVYHVKGKQFSKPDDMFLPTRNPEDLERFLKEFYEEIDVSSNAVEYIEANATGIAEADGNELEAVGRVFGKESPIKVGSVKSNMGHTQPVSGACSLTKMCLAYQNGKIPANLHFNKPLNHISAVKEEKILVVTENTSFDRGFTAINNFSFTGANFHVLLKGHYKPKNNARYNSTIPRLVFASGRQDQCVNKILDILENNPVDFEQIALLNNIFKYNIPGHTGRGYTILDTKANINETLCLARGFEYYSGTVRPVWFLYSGMGSQWVAMGAELMCIPIFAAAIERCDKVLRTKGVDIVKIITENDSKIFDDILHSFVGITAVQIGLTDILKYMGLLPDNIIGHSAGEIACAYADGCFTTEEAILVSYFRGIASNETVLIKGKMAAIGLGHKEVRKLCPHEIDIACQNSFESTTISGPAEDIDKFVAYLTRHSIFAKAVATSNIAYHSRYVADAEPKLLANMQEVLKDPKLRSKKWLSTCFLPENWNNETCQRASSEYFTHNLLNTVYFEETANLIPNDAIVIEIAPHGLMQAIMKRSHPNCLNVPLTSRGNTNNVVYMMKAIGTLYEAGLNPNPDILYPKVDFPVSTETPVLSHLVDWAHTEKWAVVSHASVYSKVTTFSCEFNLSIHDDDYKFFKGYIKNDINLCPESAILVFVWKTFAMFKNKNYESLSVVFNNIKFHGQVKIECEKTLALKVFIQRGSNLFEVTNNETLVASGSIDLSIETKERYNDVLFNDNERHVDTTDIYKLLFSRGYCYEGDFQSLHGSNIERNKAMIKWNGNWIILLDSLFQFNAFNKDYDGMSYVKHINKLSIDVKTHENTKIVCRNNEIIHTAQIFKDIDISKCGGVTLKSLLFTDIPKLEQTADGLEVRNKLGHHYTSIDTRTKTHYVQLVNDSNTYTWAELSPVPSINVIQICYAGASLNNHNSFEHNHGLNKYGMDFSGIDAGGNRVMGLVSDSLLSNFVDADSELLWPVPQYWNLEEAATVPLPYIQALYCLRVRSNLVKYSTVFVSNGDSGFGQAVISICFGYDCTVFTTVNDLEKKKFLLQLYPELDANNIGYSDDVHFKYMVINATKGKLCDIVIDGSKGTLRKAATDCVKIYKTYLDVNELGMEDNDYFGINSIYEGRAHKAVCFSNIYMKENSNERKVLQEMLCDGITKGFVRPLTRVVYLPSEISRAFKLLSTKNCRGRVLINMNDQDIFKELQCLPRLCFSPTSIYTVVCDGSELGIELIDHLIKRGARRVLINIKPKLMNRYFHLKFALWKKHYDIVNISFNADDLHTKSGCENLLAQAAKLGYIDGIFITQNEITENNMIEQDQVNHAAMTTWLDLTSRKINTLRYFAVVNLTSHDLCKVQAFSDIEKCCFERSEIGLPSLVLRYKVNKKITAKSLPKLINAFESSLKLNYTCVLSSDTIENIEAKEVTFVNGFDAFFTQILKEEYYIEPVVYMKTKMQNENESEIHLDPEEEYLIMLPGFDGFYQTLTTVSERLKMLAVTLQYENEFDQNIHEIANRLMKLVKLRYPLKSKFYIFGYSFGVNVALELAALLEKEGKIGVVYCLDSSPDALKIQLDAYLGDITDQQLQNSLIEHIYNLLTGQQSTELTRKLEDEEKWFEKIKLFIDIVKNSVTYTHEFLRTFVNAAYKRVVMSKEYKPSFKLESELVLIKGIPHPKAENLLDDYGLSKYSKQTVKVFNIAAEHGTALEDCRVSNIVNRMLEPKLLAKYEKKNLCQYQRGTERV